MNLAAGAAAPAESLAGKGMTKFVTDLDHDDAQVKQDQIIRRQNIRALMDELSYIAHNKVQSRRHERQP